jgi:hypothetical protein
MTKFDLQFEGMQILTMIKNSSFFPYKSGNLKFHATIGTMHTPTCYRIHFDSTIAPYVEYLEEGTGPHDIFPVTRKMLKFEVNGKTVFARNVHHPGSTKHKDFIKRDCVNAIVNYISTRWNGLVTVE